MVLRSISFSTPLRGLYNTTCFKKEDGSTVDETSTAQKPQILKSIRCTCDASSSSGDPRMSGIGVNGTFSLQRPPSSGFRYQPPDKKTRSDIKWAARYLLSKTPKRTRQSSSTPQPIPTPKRNIHDLTQPPTRPRVKKRIRFGLQAHLRSLDQETKRGGQLEALKDRLAQPRNKFRRSLPPREALDVISNESPRAKSLGQEYAEAFKRWDSGLSKTIPEYGSSELKRKWYAAFSDEPSSCVANENASARRPIKRTKRQVN